MSILNQPVRWGIYFALALVAMVWLAAPAQAQVCQVLDPQLQQSYQGGCLNGLAHGKGVARGEQGAYYQGQFIEGHAWGHGVKLYANGDAYAGNWVAGRREGQGVYEYGEQSPWRGDKYVGSWHNDRQHGQGSYLLFPTGEPFSANWVDGVPDAMASPLLARRKRAYQALAQSLGQVGVRVCSVLTDGAAPERMASGTVVAVQNEHIQVLLDSPEVLKHTSLKLNPRWDLMTEWFLCEAQP